MRIDVESLGTFSRLARSGTERAAESLSGLTGMGTRVSVSQVELSTRGDIRREFRENDYLSVEIGFEGGIEGRTVLAFRRDGARRVVGALLPGGTAPDDEMGRSGLKEVGNIMLGGFIDGWADHLGTTIDISTPTYVAPEAEGTFADAGAGLVEDHVMVFRNRLRVADAAEPFYLYMLPTPGSVERIREATAPDAGSVPIESLAAFEEMVTEGAEQASADITAMTGVDTAVEVSRLSFTPIESVPSTVPDEPRTGVVLEFDGTPGGYLAVLFDEASANSLAGSLMPGAAEDEAMRRSAIQEIGNIITSGFVDGWANTLETTIDISPPEFVHDLGPAILEAPATELARKQEHAILIDSTIRTADDEFTCEVYALPAEDDLQGALSRLATSNARA